MLSVVLNLFLKKARAFYDLLDIFDLSKPNDKIEGFKPNVNILRAEYMRFYCKISITFYLLLKTILFVDKRVASIEILLF